MKLGVNDHIVSNVFSFTAVGQNATFICLLGRFAIISMLCVLCTLI